MCICPAAENIGPTHRRSAASTAQLRARGLYRVRPPCSALSLACSLSLSLSPPFSPLFAFRLVLLRWAPFPAPPSPAPFPSSLRPQTAESCGDSIAVPREWGTCRSISYMPLDCAAASAHFLERRQSSRGFAIVGPFPIRAPSLSSCAVRHVGRARNRVQTCLKCRRCNCGRQFRRTSHVFAHHVIVRG